MNSKQPRRTLTVRARLLIVAGLCALLAILPTSQLGSHLHSDLSFVSGELSGLPVNRAWQRVIAAAQAHRQLAAAAAAHPEAEADRAKVAADVSKAFAELQLAL